MAEKIVVAIFIVGMLALIFVAWREEKKRFVKTKTILEVLQNSIYPLKLSQLLNGAGYSYKQVADILRELEQDQVIRQDIHLTPCFLTYEITQKGRERLGSLKGREWTL